MSRRPKAETVVAWESDVAIPEPIRRQAREIGAKGCYLRGGRVVVVLSDEREVWLDMDGKQSGRSPHGAVDVWPESVWPGLSWPLDEKRIEAA